MATLGEAGLLEQPHTSAGRVPTAAAFRYYVEQITQPEAQFGRTAGGPAGRAMPKRGWPHGSFALERGAARADRGELLPA